MGHGLRRGTQLSIPEVIKKGAQEVERKGGREVLGPLASPTSHIKQQTSMSTQGTLLPLLNLCCTCSLNCAGPEQELGAMPR